jgi:hypothetical protein
MHQMSSFSEDDIKHAAEAREWLMKQISEKQDQVDRLNTILDLIDNLLKQSSFKPASSITTSSRSSSSSSSSAGLTSQMSQKPAVSPQMMPHPPGSQTVGVTDHDDPSPSVRKSTPSSEVSERMLSNSTNERDVYRQVKPLKRLKDDFLMANAEISNDSVELVPAKGIALSVNTPPFRSFFLNRILEGMKTKDAEKLSQNQIEESASLSYNVDEDENGIIKRIIIHNYRDKERLNEIINTSTWVFTRMIEKNNNRA